MLRSCKATTHSPLTRSLGWLKSEFKILWNAASTYESRSAHISSEASYCRGISFHQWPGGEEHSAIERSRFIDMTCSRCLPHEPMNESSRDEIDFLSSSMDGSNGCALVLPKRIETWKMRALSMLHEKETTAEALMLARMHLVMISVDLRSVIRQIAIHLASGVVTRFHLQSVIWSIPRRLARIRRPRLRPSSLIAAMRF